MIPVDKRNEPYLVCATIKGYSNFRTVRNDVHITNDQSALRLRVNHYRV